jgi:hypothetical protein
MTALEESHISLQAVKRDSRTNSFQMKRGADAAGQNRESKNQQTVAMAAVSVVSGSRDFHNFLIRNPFVLS